MAAEEKGVPVAEVSGVEATAGGGVEWQVLGDRVLVGSPKFLQERGVVSATVSGQQNLYGGGVVDGAASISLVGVAVNEKLAGVLVLADMMKESTPEAVDALRKEGLRIVMLTGDRKESASMIAAQLKITEVESEVSPGQKGDIVKKLRAEGRVVAMAGDGINDAPALAAASVGIAMGTGTDVAIESAGITLLKGDLQGVVKAIKLSQAVMGNIRQNLFFAFIYNALGVPIAAGALYPAFGLLLSPVIASTALSS